MLAELLQKNAVAIILISTVHYSSAPRSPDLFSGALAD